MQREISIQPPPTTLDPLKDASGVTSIDFDTQFDGLVKKADNLQNFIEKGEAEGGLLRYLPGLALPLYQEQIRGTIEKKAFADDTYKDLKTTEFTIHLSANQYMNFHNVHLVFPLKIKKKTNTSSNIASTATTVNTFLHTGLEKLISKD